MRNWYRPYTIYVGPPGQEGKGSVYHHRRDDPWRFVSDTYVQICERCGTIFPMWYTSLRNWLHLPYPKKVLIGRPGDPRIILCVSCFKDLVATPEARKVARRRKLPRGLGSVEDREAMSVYADAIEERGDHTTAWRLRDPIPVNRQLPSALHHWQQWLSRGPRHSGRYFGRIELDNGWGVSIQASAVHYSEPRANLPSAMDYTEFEVAVFNPLGHMDSMVGTRFEEMFRVERGVAGYVPTETVTEILLFVAALPRTFAGG